MGIRELLILLLIFAIVVVVLRGLFVAISSRKNKIKIALDKNIPEYDLEELELRELPSGGARQVERSFARVMQSQGMNEPGSAKSGTGVGIPARKSTLKPPRTNVFKNRDQNRAATTAAGTVAAATAATSTMAAQAAAAEQSRSGEQTPVASSTDSHQTSAADSDVQTPSAESVETVQADHSQEQEQEMAPEPETLASTEGIDLVGTEVEEVTVNSEEAAEDSGSFEPVTTGTDIDNDDPLAESMNDDSWDNDAEVDDAWMDDVSPAREVNRTAAATTQSESSVLSESVSDQELEETEAEEEDSAEDFHEEGFDLDRAEPLFANNQDDDDWEDSDSIESDTDEDAWEDASTDEQLDDEEQSQSGKQWQAESHDDDDALFSEAAADDLDNSDWDVDDEEERPELDDWDDEEEDNNVFLSDVSEPGEIIEEREPTEDEIADIASEESAKEGIEASDNDADWDDFEDDQSEPALGEYVEEQDSGQPAVSGYDEDDASVEAEEDADLGAVNFNQDDADADPLIDEGDADSGSLDVDLVAEEYAQDEAPHPEREERDLDHVLDELLEENAAPMTVFADDVDLDDESASAKIDSAESEEERDAEEMTQDGKKTSDSLEYSANEDVDNEVLFEDRDDEDFDPLFDYSENDPENEVDTAVDQEDQLIAEEDELLEAEYSDREEKYSGREEEADVTELAEEAAQYDDVVETAEIAETAEVDEDSVPDFDDELEADAEPEPSEDDAFAAVDPEDDLDELFDDEDRLRRQAAMEEIEEKESRGRNWMSWASGAFKRLGAKKSADTIEPVESSPEQAEQQQGHRQPDQQQPQYDQNVMQDSVASQWQQDPVESDAEQDQWYEQAEESAQTEYDERYPEHQDQETVWNDADDQQGLGYPEDAYPEESAGRQQGAGSYQEQQLSLDIEMDAQAAEAAAGQQDDGYGRQRRAAPGQAPRQFASQYQQQSAFDDGFDQGAYANNGYDEDVDDDSNEPSEVLAINVLARQGRRFAGDELLQVLLSSGLRFGEMSIFHRHANGKNGPVLFSVANALNPGTFDLNEISEFTTPGVCFFMTLPNVASNNMLVYEQMLATARHVQQSLDAELKDDNRSVMTAQTMEHYRQRIRDFELQQLKHAHGRR